ncbi:MAG TPA: ATP-binding protein [Pyrinomonadaceae bacterium]|jgi:signal transduction histidine kinase
MSGLAGRFSQVGVAALHYDSVFAVNPMKALKLFYSFRARMMLVLAALLVMTLGLQYVLLVRTQRERSRIIAEQERAIMAGVALGVRSITSDEYMVDFRQRANQSAQGDELSRWVTNILVADSAGNVRDSLKQEYNPKLNKETNEFDFVPLKNIPMPPLVVTADLAGDASQMPYATTTGRQVRASDPRAFFFPVDVREKDGKYGRWHVIVVLGAANAQTGSGFRLVARSLLYTFAVMLVAILITGILVWRFTRPIKDLSSAARRIAAGDFAFRVPAADRRDEMGQLSARFNEMITRLSRTRELETQLHQAEQSAVVGRLASAIAHEIRNPLNYINLTLDHLRTAFAPVDEKKRETFERLAVQLKAEVARINARISEFLNYTRPSSLELRPLDLRAAAEDALRLVEVKAAESHIETRVEAKGQVPAVLGDAEALRSVFTNLIINGMQAIDGDGGSLTIKLSAEASGARARIDITDTGRGIAPENISKVFEPYFSTKDTGTGLGLAIVKKAVDDHGGTISVTSKTGEGTTFTITLPTADAK